MAMEMNIIVDREMWGRGEKDKKKVDGEEGIGRTLSQNQLITLPLLDRFLSLARRRGRRERLLNVVVFYSGDVGRTMMSRSKMRFGGARALL
ncbi:unnamed protein product [Linum tenue]|uniref:Uncharacterized protein n=1 Tax=Linum tenue TaxID=586396 RepID=A0AAV0QMK0_9ROSI|nr:unnamed protein product [Linum tenue]